MLDDDRPGVGTTSNTPGPKHPRRDDRSDAEKAAEARRERSAAQLAEVRKENRRRAGLPTELSRTQARELLTSGVASPAARLMARLTADRAQREASAQAAEDAETLAAAASQERRQQILDLLRKRNG